MAIRDAKEEDLQAVAEVLAAAFQDEECTLPLSITHNIDTLAHISCSIRRVETSKTKRIS
jgi:hypothetical protein